MANSCISSIFHIQQHDRSQKKQRTTTPSEHTSALGCTYVCMYVYVYVNVCIVYLGYLASFIESESGDIQAK